MSSTQLLLTCLYSIIQPLPEGPDRTPADPTSALLGVATATLDASRLWVDCTSRRACCLQKLVHTS